VRTFVREQDAARTAALGSLAAVASDPLRGASAGSSGTGTPGRLAALGPGHPHRARVAARQVRGR